MKGVRAFTLLKIRSYVTGYFARLCVPLARAQVDQFLTELADSQIIPVRSQILRICSLSSDCIGVRLFYTVMFGGFLLRLQARWACTLRLFRGFVCGSCFATAGLLLPPDKRLAQTFVRKKTPPKTQSPPLPEDSEQARRACKRTGMIYQIAHGARNDPAPRNETPSPSPRSRNDTIPANFIQKPIKTAV